MTGLRPLEELVAQLDPCSHPYYDFSLSPCRVGTPRWVPRVEVGLGVSLNHHQGSHTHAGPQPAGPFPRLTHSLTTSLPRAGVGRGR